MLTKRAKPTFYEAINFGDTSNGTQVRIGRKAQATSAELGLGKVLDRVRSWRDSKIVVKLKLPRKFEGKRRFVWMEKDGTKSNYKHIRILAPAL